MAGTTVTTLAKKKMVKARAGISSLPKIVGMAFGDGGVDSGGTVKPHSADQNTLHHELLRKNVDGYEVLSDTKIRYRCTLAENELANTYISEVFIKSRISLVQIKSLLIFAIDIPNSNRNPTSFLPFDGCIRSCVASSVKQFPIYQISGKCDCRSRTTV